MWLLMCSIQSFLHGPVTFFLPLIIHSKVLANFVLLDLLCYFTELFSVVSSL